MNLYTSELLAGVTEMLNLYKQGSNIFDMGEGSLFPTMDKQQMWQFSKAPGHLHFSDGLKTYSFKTTGAELSDEDTELDKIPDVPLPDLFKDSTSKGKAQVHRSDPGSIYFTLQEGTSNPTYTLKHTGGPKWKAVAKKKKAKQALQAPAYIPNVNVESVKEGMLKEAEELLKEGNGGLLGFFNQAGGKAVDAAVNLPFHAALLPGRIGGPPGEHGDSLGSGVLNALKSGLAGAGVGAAYHGIKHMTNSEEENEQDRLNHAMLKRIGIPALGMAAVNPLERSVFKNYYNLVGQGNTPRMTG
jgi:hypothetical protein